MFIEKLNKKQDGSIYVIEEEQAITDGRYEGNLQHDNANIKTLKVYTGSMLTGEEIINVVTSVPSDTPWKTYVKVFASTDKVYITYETPGDTVEAEDVNLLQDTAKAIREDFEQYSEKNNTEVVSLKNRMDTVEATKAATTYVDTELAKKADKSNTYTRSETDQRIQNVIGAAPDALDTLKEISAALNNDPDFAATMTKQLATKVDKVTGKGLSTEDYSTSEKSKLAGIEAGANKYVHPASHSPAMIVQDTSNRFVTDEEKTFWNQKAENVAVTQKSNGLMSKEDKSKLDGIEEGSNRYSHPNSGATAGTYQQVEVNAQGHVTSGSNPTTLAGFGITDAAPLSHVGETGNAHGTVTSSQNGFMTAADKAKLDGIANGANNYSHPNSGAIAGTYRQVTVNAQGHVTGGTNPTTLAGYGITDAVPSSHVGATGGAHGAATTSSNGFMSSTDKSKLDGVEAGANKYVHPGSGTNPHGTTKADIGLSNISNDAQVKRSELGAGSGVATLDSSGVNAQAPKAHTHDDRYYTESESDTRFATKTELSQAGKGDMLKSVYDADGDGIVDNANKVNGHTVEIDVPASAKLTDTVYTHPAGNGYNHVPAGGASGQILRWSTSGTASWGAENNTTYSPATASANGLMSAADKTKLDKLTFPVTWGQLKGV